MQPSDYAWSYLFILPFLILFAAFSIWPIVATIGLSFFRYNGIGPLKDFVALKNYVQILHDSTFLRAFSNTVIFALVQSAIKLPISLLLAIVLTRSWLKARIIFRTVFFLPLLVPSAIVGMVFHYLLNPANGAINNILMNAGLVTRPIDFLASRWGALATISVIDAWNVIGLYVLYWMAALQNVPEEVYEAAEIDGANEWQKLVWVTLPIIRPIAFVVAFLGFVNALKIFDLVLVMTGGGPGSQTFVMSYYVYVRAFVARPTMYGTASTAAVVFGFAMLLAVSVQGYVVARSQRASQELRV